MQSIERSMAAAYSSGHGAAKSGMKVTENPFDPSAKTAVERVQAIMWVRGYGTGNPVDPEADVTERVG